MSWIRKSDNLKWNGLEVTPDRCFYLLGVSWEVSPPKHTAIAELTLYDFFLQQREMDINTQIYGVPISFVGDNSEWALQTPCDLMMEKQFLLPEQSPVTNGK